MSTTKTPTADVKNPAIQNYVPTTDRHNSDGDHGPQGNHTPETGNSPLSPSPMPKGK